jgi:uncharacterized protein YndB with AHSA1/START domain
VGRRGFASYGFETAIDQILQQRPGGPTEMLKTTIQAAAWLALTATSAFALTAEKTVDIKAPPAKVWAEIGDFCGIAQWHPAIAGCTLSKKGRATLRTLALKGGGTIVERQVSRHEKAMEYTYAIVQSPLPVAQYRSTIKVTPNGDGSTVTWSGTFVAKGADDAKATAAIQGIYDSGLAALTEKVQ